MALSGLLCLKWTNHNNTFLGILNVLHEKELYSDATIACQGKYYPVHRIVLASCSKYFEEIFERTRCQHPYIILKDIEPSEVEGLLNYMYKGEVNVSHDKVAGLVRAAESLKIKGLAVPDEAPRPPSPVVQDSQDPLGSTGKRGLSSQGMEGRPGSTRGPKRKKTELKQDNLGYKKGYGYVKALEYKDNIQPLKLQENSQPLKLQENPQTLCNQNVPLKKGSIISTLCGKGAEPIQASKLVADDQVNTDLETLKEIETPFSVDGIVDSESELTFDNKLSEEEEAVESIVPDDGPIIKEEPKENLVVEQISTALWDNDSHSNDNISTSFGNDNTSASLDYDKVSTSTSIGTNNASLSLSNNNASTVSPTTPNQNRIIVLDDVSTGMVHYRPILPKGDHILFPPEIEVTTHQAASAESLSPPPPPPPEVTPSTSAEPAQKAPSSNVIYGCHICPYKCIKQQLLEKHLARHQEKKSVKRTQHYRCTLCPFISYYKTNIGIHMRSHFTQKPNEKVSKTKKM